jgi:hypothetical protein
LYPAVFPVLKTEESQMPKTSSVLFVPAVVYINVVSPRPGASAYAGVFELSLVAAQWLHTPWVVDMLVRHAAGHSEGRSSPRH